MAGAGYGAGGWGSVPWGGAEQFLEPEECDLFLFEDNLPSDCGSMGGILSDPIVTPTGGGTQFVLDYPDGPTPPDVTCDLGILSGDIGDPGFDTSTAYLTAVPLVGIDDEYTLEVTLVLESLPNDFTNLEDNHVMFGVTDSTGPCAAFFLSKVGIAYAGAVHHVPPSPSLGTLVLDSTFQQLPGTAPLTPEGVSMTYRVAVSNIVNAVYLFATPTADLPVTGHQLVAVLPVIDAADLILAPALDRALISVAGTSAVPSRVALDRWCLSSQFIIANIAPVANAGTDQAVRQCSIAMLDGTASFDPEGAPLLYQWRLIDAPPTSEFVVSGTDGKTFPSAPFDGFAQKFYSDKLSTVEAADAIDLGDVLLVAGVAYSIISKGTDIDGFYVTLDQRAVPDTLVLEPFKLLRQRGISNPTTATPTFFPDVPGFYKFDLVVSDGSLLSDPSVVTLSVQESVLPRNCVPDGTFLFNYVTDFWKLVEDVEERLAPFWSGLAQVAAAELLTLWQYEYSKSIRDVQRTTIRKWLHYDLLLAEPIPELTRIRAIWSGVESLDIPVAGDPGIPSTSLVLTSPLWEAPVVLDIFLAELAADLRDELTRRLAEVDSRFTVELLSDKAGVSERVRIDAPFPFTVDVSSTIPVFAAGTSSGVLEGSGGAASGARSYVLDRSVQGADIQEDDLLVLDGIGYRIVRVVDGAPTDPDAFPFQRVTLKDALPIPASSSWKICSTVRSELLNFYNGMVSAGDAVFLEVGDELVQTEALGALEALPGTLALDVTPVGAALVDETQSVYLAKIVRRTYLPVSSLLKDLPALQPNIEIRNLEDDQATLRRNLDFFLEEFRGASAIRFVSGNSPDVWEGEVPPDRLWAEYSYIDNNPVIEANFGIPAGFTLDQLEQLPEQVDYLSAVRGLWFAYFNGPEPDDIRVGAQIFLGLPFAEKRGTIEEIRTDFSPSRGRILVRDVQNTQIVRSYTFPSTLALEVNPATGERYAEGDEVQQFAPLVEGVEVVDYINEPEWFKGLIAQGVFAEVQKFHTHVIRIDSEAFSLASVLLIRDFVLNIKPTYRYPIFLVVLDTGITDIDVVDQLQMHVTLNLNDMPCLHNGTSMYDDAHPSGGGYWNQYDTDDDPVSLPPTFPTPDSEITWGFDDIYLCPDDFITATCIISYGAPTVVSFDSCLKYDTEVETLTRFAEAVPVTVPAVPGEHTVPLLGSALAPLTGSLSKVRLVLLGGSGGFPTDYEVVVTVNAVDTAVVPFSDTGLSTDVSAPLAGAVTAGDTIGLKIRIPAGSPSPGERHPDWTLVLGFVVIEDSLWSYGDILPAGTYISEVVLT